MCVALISMCILKAQSMSHLPILNQIFQTVNDMAFFINSLATIKVFSSRSFGSLTCGITLTAFLPCQLLLPWSLTRHDYHDKMGLWGASLALSSALFSVMFYMLLFYLSSIWFNSTSSPYRLARQEAQKQPSAYLWDPDCSTFSTLYIQTRSTSSPQRALTRWVPAGCYYFCLCPFYIVDNGRYWPIPNQPLFTSSSLWSITLYERNACIWV